MNSSIFLNKAVRRAALTSVVAVGAFGASNSFAADGTTTSTATVIEPIAITNTASLEFGSFAPGTGGSVTVATDGTRSATGAILSSVGTAPAAAQFDVTGDNDATYSISWSGATDLSDGAATPSTMALTRISALTADGATTGEVNNGTLSGTGAQTIFLGGELAVDAAQTAGTYTGDVIATVEYN